MKKILKITISSKIINNKINGKNNKNIRKDISQV